MWLFIEHFKHNFVVYLFLRLKQAHPLKLFCLSSAAYK